MSRSEASRAKDRARVKAWRKKNPERRRANQRRHNRTYYWKHAEKMRARARERRINAQYLYEESLSLVTKIEAQSPRLYYIDPHGHVHLEEELSAEELIRRYKESQRKEGHP